MSAIVSSLKDIYKGTLRTVVGLFDIFAGIFLISSKTVEFGGKGVEKISEITGGKLFGVHHLRHGGKGTKVRHTRNRRHI